jgi:hypothetical protein
MKRCAFFVTLALLPIVAAAQLRVTRAVVFKNGLAFLMREGTLTFADGRAQVAPAPQALLGTLWITAGGRAIDEVRATKETQETTEPVTSIAALLDANVGKVATLRIGDAEYTGTLLKSVNGLVFINGDGKVSAFDRTSVSSVAFAQSPATSGPAKKSEVTLSIRSKGADAAVPASISYLRNGVSWMPEYSIELLDKEKARLTMQATLINDGEELRDTSVRFTVGYPNFQFSHLPDPMTLQLTLQDFLARLNGGGSDEGRFANVTSQMVNVAGYVNLTPAPPATPLAGESAEDLFFYERQDVTLAEGERAAYTVLSDTVPYRHIYLWEVPAEVEATRDAEKHGGQVWHSIAVTNTGSTPWTTAPALVLSNGKPLAQDTLAYTAAGGRGKVKLTVATDISVEREEVELERKPRDVVRFGSSWDALTVEGTLTMHSYKREPITLSVEKLIEGSTLSRDPEGKVTRKVRLKAINASERLEWEVPLGAGETKTIKYRYRVWVRE